MADASDLLGRSASDLAGLVARREVSATETVRAALDATARLDGITFAFCTLDANGALAAAVALDRRLATGEPAGALAGVPVAIKDLISTRGLRTTFGSRLYADFVPDEDDVVVERLRAAGAIVIGKTNTSEFGYGPFGHNHLFPTTRNPWNPALTPGGSSAGSSAAVAAGMVPLALGSDGGGSVRVPAALTGIVGMKPSWGRVPLWPGCRDAEHPGASGWELLEHIGPLARTVDDVALALRVLAGPDPRDRHSLPAEDWFLPRAARPIRVAWSPALGFAAVDPEVAAITERAALRFERDLGWKVERADPPIGDTQAVFEALVALDTDRVGLRAMAQKAGVSPTPMLASLLDRPWTADEFTAAILGRKRVAKAMAAFMAGYDLLLTPSTGAAAFPVDSDGPRILDGHPVPASAWTGFSAVANLTGQPAISVPAGMTAEGRPVGLQIIGRHLDDGGIIAAARAFEHVAPWADLWPPVSVEVAREAAA